MFSQAFVCPSPGGGVTPNVSWDRSHGRRGRGVMIWLGGGGSCHLARGRSGQYLPQARSQHLPPAPPPWPGHNTSPPGQVTTPPPPPGQVTTSPPQPGRNTSPSPWLGHNTSLPSGKVITPPLARSQPSPPPAKSQYPPSPALCAGGQYASYWNAFLFEFSIDF